MRTIWLINPNTSVLTTDRMVDIARRAAGERVTVSGLTAPFGAPLITDEAALATAAKAVAAAADTVRSADVAGIIISAFGDPGLETVKARHACPVVGIAEASMLEAARGGRQFSVATTTPRLVAAIKQRAERYGVGRQLRSVRIPPGDATTLMSDNAGLLVALRRAVTDAIEQDGAEAVIIGGGPLAEAARELALEFAAPIIEPIPVAVRLLLPAPSFPDPGAKFPARQQ